MVVYGATPSVCLPTASVPVGTPTDIQELFATYMGPASGCEVCAELCCSNGVFLGALISLGAVMSWVCTKCYGKAYYEEHREEILLKGQAYYEEHREEILLKGKLWRVANHVVNPYGRTDWYFENREVELPKQIAYNALHKDEINEKKRERVPVRCCGKKDVSNGDFKRDMLRHFKHSPSCVEIFLEFHASGKLQDSRELKLLVACGRVENDELASFSKEKKRRWNVEDQKKNRAKKGLEKAQKVEDSQEFWKELNMEQQVEAFRARFRCFEPQKPRFMLAKSSRWAMI